ARPHAIAEVFAMPAPVVEHVRQRVARIARGLDLLRTVAIPKDRPAPAVACEDRARAVDREALHAARQSSLVGRLDEQMEMRRLDRQMDDPEVLATQVTLQHAMESAIDLPPTHAKPTLEPERRVHRILRRQLRSLVMRDVATPP